MLFGWLQYSSHLPYWDLRTLLWPVHDNHRWPPVSVHTSAAAWHPAPPLSATSSHQCPTPRPHYNWKHPDLITTENTQTSLQLKTPRPHYNWKHPDLIITENTTPHYNWKHHMPQLCRNFENQSTDKHFKDTEFQTYKFHLRLWPWDPSNI